MDTVARGLGFTQIAKSGNEVVRWERVNKYIDELGFSIPTSGHDTFIPEINDKNISHYKCQLPVRLHTTAEIDAALVLIQNLQTINYIVVMNVRRLPSEKLYGKGF